MGIQLEASVAQSIEPIQDNRYSCVHRKEQLELRVALSKIYRHNLSQQHVGIFTDRFMLPNITVKQHMHTYFSLDMFLDF